MVVHKFANIFIFVCGQFRGSSLGYSKLTPAGLQHVENRLLSRLEQPHFNNFLNKLESERSIFNISEIVYFCVKNYQKKYSLVAIFDDPAKVNSHAKVN